MLCECGEREATIHEVIIRDGKTHERHLCEQCAVKYGIEPKPQPNLAQLVSQFVLPQIAAKAKAAQQASALVCSACGMSFQDFGRAGLLGCAECYRVFADQLGHLLERAHEGATHHVGKIPRRALAASRGEDARETMDDLLGTIEERAERVTTLRHQLDDAVRAEQYELAAQVRDELLALTQPVSAGPSVANQDKPSPDEPVTSPGEDPPDRPTP